MWTMDGGAESVVWTAKLYGAVAPAVGARAVLAAGAESMASR